MKTIALIYILLLIYSTIQAQTVPAMKNFNLNYKFYKNDFADEWVEVKGENFYRECKDEWINSIINVEESGKVLHPLRFKSGSIGLPTNPVQQLSKGAGFSQAFEVFSPYNIQFNYYTIEDFQNVKKLGLNSIRLPIFMDNMFEEKSSTMNPLFFYLLDQYVDMAENEGLNLILTNMSGFDYANDPIIQDKFINIWKQMAEHYKNRSTKILYELANEPNGITDEAWGQIQGNVIDVIRKIDQTHTIIVTPIWDGLANLEKLPDYEDENLIYAFHFYDPFLFTHQGVINASLGDLVGVPFPYNEEEMPSMPASFVGNWYEGLYYDYKTDATAVEIRKLIDTAAKFKNERNVPLWCGEFGVVGGTDHDDRVYWYNVLRSSLEENGIPWSMHGYIRYSGPFEYGTYHLFDHDLDIPLVEAMGLAVPPQTDFIVEPEAKRFEIYNDYPSRYIYPWISSDEGTTHLLSEENPFEGKFCIYTEDFPLWSVIDFRFEPYRDLSELVENGYILEFMVKGDTPGAKFNVRFMDTETKDPEDHSWRIVHDVDETMATWDGEWHLIQIPLSDFIEQGTWDGEWFNPEGKFDWKAIGSFQITTEFHSFEGMKFWFDNIRIVKGLQIDSVNVTFQVDIQNETVSPSGVYMMGSWDNWKTAVKLNNTTDKIYSTVLTLTPGIRIEYKFYNGNPAGNWEEYKGENFRGSCTDEWTNRFFNVPDEAEALEPVCFNSCEICVPVVSDSVNVTFQVDIQNETVSPSGIHLNGSFCNWTPANAVKLSAAGSVYSTTMKLKKGKTIEYKFVNGAASQWSQYETINGLPCEFGYDANRGFVVPNEDVILDLVCFKKCEKCSPVLASAISLNKITIYPNPAENTITIAGLPERKITLEIQSIEGKKCLEIQTNSNSDETINISSFESGIYFVKMKSAETVEILTWIKK